MSFSLSLSLFLSFSFFLCLVLSLSVCSLLLSFFSFFLSFLPFGLFCVFFFSCLCFSPVPFFPFVLPFVHPVLPQFNFFVFLMFSFSLCFFLSFLFFFFTVWSFFFLFFFLSFSCFFQSSFHFLFVSHYSSSYSFSLSLSFFFFLACSFLLSSHSFTFFHFGFSYSSYLVLVFHGCLALVLALQMWALPGLLVLLLSALHPYFWDAWASLCIPPSLSQNCFVALLFTLSLILSTFPPSCLIFSHVLSLLCASPPWFFSLCFLSLLGLS